MKAEVARCMDLAFENSDEGIMALIWGMKNRPERSDVLSNSKLPLLLIGGEKDNYIPMEVFKKLVVLAPHATVLRLQHSGHMEFLEEAEIAAEALRGFAIKCGPGSVDGVGQL